MNLKLRRALGYVFFTAVFYAALWIAHAVPEAITRTILGQW